MKPSRSDRKVFEVEGHNYVSFAVKRRLQNKLVVWIEQLRPQPMS